MHRSYFIAFLVPIFIAIVARNIVHLYGSGASFPNEVYKAWIAHFQVFRGEFTALDIFYDAVGSGEGKAQIQSDNPKDYAGSDSFLPSEAYEKKPDLQMFPTMAGSVVIVFNIPGLSTINITREALVGIFSANITRWNDAAIQRENPAAKLPNETIKVMVEVHEAGMTEILTSALSSFSPAWAKEYGIFSKGLNHDTDLPYYWNPKAIAYYGHTTKGISGLILSIKYSISYISLPVVQSDGLTYALLQNQAGKFVAPTVESVQSAMSNLATAFNERFNIRLVNAPGEDSYPIAGYTYMIVHLSTMIECDVAYELYRYIEWFLEDEKAHSDAIRLNFVPLPEQVADMVREKVLMRITCLGESVHDLAEKKKGEEKRSKETWRLTVTIIAPIAAFMVLSIPSYFILKELKLRQTLLRGDWKILIEHIKLSARNYGSRYSSQTTNTISKASLPSQGSNKTNSSAWENGKAGGVASLELSRAAVGQYNGELISLKWLDSDIIFGFKTCKQFLWLQTKVHHLNVTRFLGMTLSDDAWYIVQEHGKRALNDVLQNERFNLDQNFKFSMSTDIAEGMEFLHSMGIIHGNLSSSCCFVDSKWTIKINDWFFPSIANAQGFPQNWKRPRYIEKNLLSDENIKAKEQFWTAPEILNGTTTYPTKQSDVYSFGVIVIEIFTREDPYYDVSTGRLPKDIIADVMHGNLRPKLPEDYPTGIQKVTKLCFSNSVMHRPPFSEIKQSLKDAQPSNKGVLDNLMESLEKYMHQLEEKVEERTGELSVVMKRMETLLHQMLPPEIAMKLSNGEHVEAESFDDVTIFFSDIVGFTSLSSESAPIEIVNFLNDLYTTFDDILDRHDVYKVETIGDAYMVSSGLPKRNGIAHAGHIATMALELMIASDKFEIRHRPDQDLLLRAGVHTGSVCAGVVGIKMPRYCLFGDTVNTASRMESTSVAMKIQISGTAYERLRMIGGFHCVERGEVYAKGKGQMMTYWLHGKNGLESQIPFACTRKVVEDSH